MSVAVQPQPASDIDLPKLEKSLRSPRAFFSYSMSVFTGAVSFIAMVPLASVLIMLIMRGIQRINIHLFTELPPAAGVIGGGIGNALIGTIVVVAIATAISVP